MTPDEAVSTPRDSGLWSADGTRLAFTTGPPQEKCGFLRGRGERITTADFVANVSPTPETHFEIDPAALLTAYRSARSPRSLELLGYFHTHLSGSCEPSATDAALAAPDGKLWLIATSLSAALWRAVPDGRFFGRFDPVRFNLKVGKRLETGIDRIVHPDLGKCFDVHVEGETHRICVEEERAS